MFNLVIIDDEALVLDSLKTFVSYEDFGFNLAEVFTSGSKAIEYIKTNHVDAVITDIKMGETDGFAIAKFCHEFNPDIQIAFISAYRDFEYAKNAITHHVTNYLTKPFVYEEYIDMLKTFYTELSKKQSSVSTSFIDNKFRTDCQRLFSDLLCKNITEAKDFEDRLSVLSLKINPYNFNCAIVRIHISNFKQYLSDEWHHEEFLLYNSIDNIVPFYANSLYTFSILHSKSDIDFLILSEKNEENLEAVISSHMQSINSALKSLLQLDSSYDIVQIYTSFEEIINTDITDIGSNDTIGNDTIAIAMDYVEKCYPKISGINEVAQMVSLSPVYFGSFFKQSTGLNFNTYLNNIKIEKAKELIADDNIKISNIAFMVGYNSQRYFFKMFKQFTGMTPTQYKDTLDDKGA